MATKTSIPKIQKTVPISKKPDSASPLRDLLQIMDDFLNQRLGWLIWVILGVTFIFSLLLFDSRVSLSGDDSFYIIRASDFIQSFKYPGFQGPLYPMVLSIFVALFGISLVPLKIFSMLLVMGFMYFFFLAYRSRIPATLLVISLSLISINSFVLYYSSQTYNEAFYLFVQVIAVFVFFRYFIDNEISVSDKLNLKRHLLLALCLLALTLTKNIGFSAVFAVGGYFIFRGQWKNLLFSILAFGLLMLVFQGVKFMFWHDAGLQFSSQGSGLLNKDYYNPQAGKEDLAGFFTRLVDNSQLYISKHFVSMLGLRTLETNMSVNSGVTLLVYLLAIGSLVITFRKNSYLFFTGLLTGSFLLISFVILQVKWDQSRLIIPAVPMLILMIFAFIYYLSKIQTLKLLQVVIPALALLVFLQSFALTVSSVKSNQEISGRYGGLTPDWKNYLKASEWAATNLPKQAIVACRKPSLSFVYGKGRNFYGIMQLPSYNTDLFIKNCLKNQSSYMLFNYSEFSGRQLTNQLYSMLKQNMAAMLFIGDSVYFADLIDDSIKQTFNDEVNKVGLKHISSINDLKPLMDAGQVIKVYYPDSLLSQLQKEGVTHVLTASLRRNSTKKDGYTINTVERYMAFIQEKYPMIFSKVSQVGTDDGEPATIYQIEYEKYGRSVSVKPGSN